LIIESPQVSILFYQLLPKQLFYAFTAHLYLYIDQELTADLIFLGTPLFASSSLKSNHLLLDLPYHLPAHPQSIDSDKNLATLLRLNLSFPNFIDLFTYLNNLF